MKINYQLSYIDFYLFNAIHQFRSLVVQIFYLGIALFFPLIQYDDYRPDLAPYIATSLGLLIYLFLWIFQYFFNLFYLYSKKNRALLCEHKIEILPDELYDETALSRTYHRWNTDMKVVNIPRFIAIYTTTYHASIIPKRAFQSLAEQKAFHHLLLEKIAAAKGTQ